MDQSIFVTNKDSIIYQIWEEFDSDIEYFSEDDFEKGGVLLLENKTNGKSEKKS